LFFGAAKSFVTALEKNFDVKVVILDMENVPVIDTTGAVAIDNIVERLHRDKKRLLIVGMRDKVRKVLYDLEITRRIGIGNFLNTVDEAIEYALEVTKQEVERTYLGGFVSETLIMLDVSAKDRDDLLDKMVTQAACTFWGRGCARGGGVRTLEGTDSLQPGKPGPRPDRFYGGYGNKRARVPECATTHRDEHKSGECVQWVVVGEGYPRCAPPALRTKNDSTSCTIERVKDV
jgi:anti-anti-sigma regulatory factor